MAQYSSSLDEGRITFDRKKADTGSLDQTKAKDVVCGKMVDVRDAVTASFGGHTYYFCSPECEVSFEADPNKFSES
jgi:YHS domain-containing protein